MIRMQIYTLAIAFFFGVVTVLIFKPKTWVRAICLSLGAGLFVGLVRTVAVWLSYQ